MLSLLLVNLQSVRLSEVLASCRIHSKYLCQIDNRENPVDIKEGDSIKMKIENIDTITKFHINQVEETPIMMRSIPLGIFKNFLNLQELNIYGIKDTVLRSEYFEGGDKLAELTLENNNIQTIPSKVFKSLSNVTRIFLGYNKIEIIEDYAFEGMDKLNLVGLNSNKIKILTRYAFFGAPLIEHLYLTYNLIETIEGGSLALPNLKEIKLDYNKLTTLTDSLFTGAPNLVKAEFLDNTITNIGKVFDNCQKLEELRLYGNPIVDVNLLSLANLENLKILDLQSTQFKFSSEKPMHISTKSKLKKIILSSNDLSNPDILTYLSLFGELEEIVSYYNNFTTFNDASNIKNYFPYLKRINLSRNKGSICEWIKENQKFLTGISVWSSADRDGSNECGSLDYRREAEPRGGDATL